VDIKLAEMGITPRTEVATSSFARPAVPVGRHRLVAMMHLRFAQRIAEVAEIRLLDPPIALEPIVETMYWHPRRAFDPGHRWLRGVITDVASTSEPLPGVPNRVKFR
jgi:hypothetical protein